MKIEEIMTELRAVVDAADSEQRSMTEEEMSKYESLESELKAAQTTEEIRARQEAYEAPINSIPPVSPSEQRSDDTLDRAFESYLRTGIGNDDLSDHRAQAPGREQRAQSVGTDSAGGYTAPDGFRNMLMDRLVDFGGLAGVVQELTTETGNPLPWPTLDDTGNVGEIVAENDTFSAGDDLVFGEKTVGAYKYTSSGAGGAPLSLSYELVQDSAVDIQSVVTGKLSQRIGRIQAQHIVTGSGSGEPEGIVTGVTGVEIADDTAGITYDDLLTFIHSVDPAYRKGARWAFNDASLLAIRKLKDADGNPLWRPDNADMATPAGGGTLLGYPVTIDQAFPDIDLDSNTVNWGVFGNLKLGYVIRRVKAITVIVNPYSSASYGKIEYSAWGRMDAVQQQTNAYVALTGEAV